MPLVLLAIPSVVIGFFTMEPLVFGGFLRDAISMDGSRHSAVQHIAEHFHGVLAMTVHGLITPPFWFMAIGVAAAAVLYLGKNTLAAQLRRKLAPLVRVLENKYYLDWFYTDVVARGACGLGQFLWRRVDSAWMWFLDQGLSRLLRRVGEALGASVERLLLWFVDDVLTGLARFLGLLLWKGGDEGIIEARFVNASWKAVGVAAARLRLIQTGYLYHYALIMILGLLALLTWVVWIF